MNEPLAYLNGKILPTSQLALPVYDAGFVQGVTVAEQLRTFGGQLFRLEQHLARLARSLKIVGVVPGVSLSDLAQLAKDLAAGNHAHLSPGSDLGLSIFVTPGPYATFAPRDASTSPTVGIHTYPLPFHFWSHLYSEGQALVTTRVRQVPTECWPAELKCRSRMHYYLADREARAADPAARALLLDLQDRVVEASSANVVIYRRAEGIVSPPVERILHGISVGVLEELATSLRIPFVHRDLSVEEVASADEVMLCSTSPCVWPCVRLNGRAIGDGKPGEISRRLLRAWSDLVGLDIAAQAVRLSS
jgi:branched-chain amino acid aminotransferase